MSRFAFLAILALLSISAVHSSPFDLKQKDMTDACLSDISKIATAIPKIIDDIKRGDMISLMTDVMSTIPLFNQTKNDCRGFHPDDMVNQTTMDNIKLCMHTFPPIIDSIEVVLMDIIHGKFTDIYDHVLLVLRNAGYSLRMCANIAEFVEYPKVILNFYNTTQCWNNHQRSANLLHAILHDLQVGNITDALNLALPFVSATADSLRFCSINLSEDTLYTISQEIPVEVQYYSFVENQGQKEECQVNLAEVIQAISADPQDLGKLVSLVPKLKNCQSDFDIGKLVKNPVVRQIVKLSMAKTFA